MGAQFRADCVKTRNRRASPELSPSVTQARGQRTGFRLRGLRIAKTLTGDDVDCRGIKAESCCHSRYETYAEKKI